MSNQQEGNQQKQQNNYTYTVIRIALIIAIVSIGINTYVLWNIYSNNVNDENPIETAVQSLSKQVDNQAYSIEQRLVSLERSITESLADNTNYQAIMAELDELKDLKETLNSLSEKTEQYGKVNSRLLELMSVLQTEIEQYHHELVGRVEVLEDKLENGLGQQRIQNGDVHITVKKGDSIWSLASRFKNPPDTTMIDRIIEYNKIIDPTQLKVGQVIVIPEN
ncbi:MAG: LysM peptidoglycan-binding domain-containing protein [Firmicutes bacterium]|nr:LysM peptidoglycan-binding domain-containing protein [Bacillota bacterium]